MFGFNWGYTSGMLFLYGPNQNHGFQFASSNTCAALRRARPSEMTSDEPGFLLSELFTITIETTFLTLPQQHIVKIKSLSSDPEDSLCHLIWRSFILLPEQKKPKANQKNRSLLRAKRYNPTASVKKCLPRPLRNLLTPLGSGSGHESRYSATLTSNRPGRRERRIIETECLLD